MALQQITTVEGKTIVCWRAKHWIERHEMPSEEEAQVRAAVINEAMSWVGTPFVDCADVKGPNGGVDCAMLMTRAFVDGGMLKPYDPRPYFPDWMMSQTEQRFLGWIEDKLGGIRTTEPKPGDGVVWQFAHCFSHGAILINSKEVVHAFKLYQFCTISPLDEETLMRFPLRSYNYERPRLFFNVYDGEQK